MDKLRINLYDLISCFTNAQGLISDKLLIHEQQVTYLCYRLAESMNFTTEETKDLLIAAVIHDIGVLSKNEALEIIEKEPLDINHHAFKGSKLLEDFNPLRGAANIIRYHHIPWQNGEGRAYKGREVPLSSHVIHIADRFCARIDPSRNIITQLPDMIKKLEEAKDQFHPDLLNAIISLSEKDYIWLDLTTSNPLIMIPDDGLFDTLILEMDDIIDLALLFSQIIDFRSHFTSKHSAGVAKTAEQLAKLIGFSPYECKMMLIAGYLHDFGKIAIDKSILEKPGKLSPQEFNEIRAHTYYTYHLLDTIPQFNTIKLWASFHHEKLNGNGYPFHFKGENLNLGSRIMAVADIYTAITEDRPYRVGMSSEQAKYNLIHLVSAGALDQNVVNVLIENFDLIEKVRTEAQTKASEKYENYIKYEKSSEK